MEDEISLLLDDLGSTYSDTRRKAALSLERYGHACLHPLVDALKSTNPILRMEASRLIIRLTQHLTAEPQPSPEEEVPKQNAIGLVMALQNPRTSYREMVEERLFQLGDEAISPLIQVLPSATPIHASRVASMLARLQAVEAIPALVSRLTQNMEKSPEPAIASALNDLIRQLPLRWRHINFETLILLLADNAGIEMRSESLDSALAVTLIRMAQEEPTPQLRQALPYLKRPWYRRSHVMESARQAVEKATRQWKDLPLPAQNSGESNNLPVPTTSTDDTAVDLPQPVDPV